MQIESTIDRLFEASFHLDQMELAYHSANRFRWCLNCFLRSLKEVPDLLTMELQNKPDFPSWMRPRRKALMSDNVVGHFFKLRDGVVHKSMLKPASSGFIGITEGRGIKLGLGLPIDPLEDSDQAMERYLYACARGSDPICLLMPDEESLPCVKRHWALDSSPDRELTEIAAEAWLKVAGLVSDAVVWLGDDAINFSCDLLPEQRVRVKTFDRDHLRQVVRQMKKDLRKGAKSRKE